MLRIDCGLEDEVHVHVEAETYEQNCPCCKSAHTVRNGKDGYRRVRHLPISGKKCLLIAPKVRLECKTCGATYAYEYTFVSGKQRYTKAYKAHLYEMAIGSTVKHTAEITQTPYSTTERLFKETITYLAPVTKEHVQGQALNSAKLILGIDDFAIRKGHNYNTGIHDLRGESFLDIIEGRTLSELRLHMENNPLIALLKPFAIVMDLAQAYHTFSKEFFPEAIRVADRFHVNGYIMDALNEVRRRISKELAPQARLNLKRYKHLLNKRNDSLTDAQQSQLDILLSYSDDLKSVYELKEQLIVWYDCSANHQVAQVGFQRWLDIGRSFCIPEIDKALKTFANWRIEITNYHLCRFTNGIVEGRNGKIKSLQRRRFFVQNRTFYESLIILECNKEIAQEQFRRIVS